MQRPLGRTGALASAIGQGTTKTGPWSDASAIRDQERIAVLQHGIELGMHLIDTAELYGGGHAEDVVGRAIAGRRDRVVLASKFNPAHSGYASLLAAAEASLRRLRTDYLDLYQLHWPEPRIPFEETVAALERLVADGKVRWVGFGNMTPAQIARARRMASGLPVVSVQVEYNLVQRAAEDDVLPYCEEAGLTPLAYSVLDRGASMAPGPRRALLARLATKHECTVAQIMIAWVLRRPGVIALVKAASRQHTTQNAAAVGVQLDSVDVTALDQLFEQQVLRIAPERIDVRGVYATAEEARRNVQDLVPAPRAVAECIDSGQPLKPLPLAASSEGRAGRPYALLDGEVLYWGWVLARGLSDPMPAFVRDGSAGMGEAT